MYKRYLGHPDAEKLIIEYAKNQDQIPELEILKRFPKFADAIEAVHSQYEERIQMSARSLEISSEELTEALRHVEKLNTNLDAMLNGLGQGLVFFDENGICSDLCSSAITRHLGEDPHNKSIPTLLGLEGDKADHFYRWLSIFFKGSVALDFDDLKELLPTQHINRDGLIIQLDYKPIYSHEQTLTGILLITTDITEEHKARENFAKLEKENKKIMAIAMDRNGFQDFIQGLQDTLQDIEKSSQENITPDRKTTFIRQLHTSKGIAGIYFLDKLVGLLHQAESILEAMDFDTPNLNPITETLQSIHQVLDTEISLARQIFGECYLKNKHIKEINTSELWGLKKLISENIPDESAARLIHTYINTHLLSVPSKDAFLSFQREITRLAEIQGKPLPTVKIEGESFPIIIENYTNFFMSLIHIARNIVDHGIESAEERLSNNKSAEATISVSCSLHSNKDKEIKIIIQDDGKGICTKRIENNLKDLGKDLPDDCEDKDILNMIFEPSFTMSNDLTTLSGRGYGLSALKQAVDDLNGNIHVESTYGNGTAFHITLPYLE